MRLGIVVGGVLAVLGAYVVAGPDTSEVERTLEEKYGVEQVEWGNSARFESEVLVVDGQDISEDCTVRGEWASLDNLRIECDGASLEDVLG